MLGKHPQADLCGMLGVLRLPAFQRDPSHQFPLVLRNQDGITPFGSARDERSLLFLVHPETRAQEVDLFPRNGINDTDDLSRIPRNGVAYPDLPPVPRAVALLHPAPPVAVAQD